MSPVPHEIAVDTQLFATELKQRLQEYDEFFRMPELSHLGSQRRIAALEQLQQNGSYSQTAEEILIGAKLSWRNTLAASAESLGVH
jgi:nitric-oxide synthase